MSQTPTSIRCMADIERAHRRKGRASRVGAWLLGIATAVAASSWVLGEAMHEKDGQDYWSVAVPGTLTGVGTIGLSVVTVVLAYQSSRRDDRLRREDREAIAEQRIADQQLAEQGRKAEADARGRREASKVYGGLDFLSNDQPAALIRNYGDDPIFMVAILSGVVTFTGPPSMVWHTAWNPDSESRAIVPAGGKATEEVFLVQVTNDEGTPWASLRGTPPESLGGYTSQLAFCWLDGAGNTWRRDGIANRPYRWTPTGQIVEWMTTFGYTVAT